jgi:hypothetical protein
MGYPDGDRQRAARARRILDRAVRFRGDAPAAPPAPADSPSPAPAAEAPDLHARVAHLETVLEALQDQVYRDAQRHQQELADLRTQLQPENVAKALSADARRRGL